MCGYVLIAQHITATRNSHFIVLYDGMRHAMLQGLIHAAHMANYTDLTLLINRPIPAASNGKPNRCIANPRTYAADADNTTHDAYIATHTNARTNSDTTIPTV